MTRLFSVVFDALDHVAQARWWAGALGTTTADERDDEAWLVLPNGFELVFVPTVEPKTTKNRIHLDLATSSHDEHTVLVERLVADGATRVVIGQPDESDWVVLADPEGNELCVLEPRPALGYDGALGVICLDTADVVRVAEFWELASGWSRIHGDETWSLLRHPSGLGPYLSIGGEREPKTTKNRVHLDVAPLADGDHDAEIEVLLAAGARRIDIGQHDVAWTVLADPAGNELCVLTPR